MMGSFLKWLFGSSGGSGSGPAAPRAPERSFDPASPQIYEDMREIEEDRNTEETDGEETRGFDPWEPGNRFDR